MREYEIIQSDLFESWISSLSEKSRLQIYERLRKIEKYGHFGVYKHLVDEIWELKWENGNRVYYSYLKEFNILILLGGNKNGQSKDIKKSKKIYQEYKKTYPV